MNEIVVPVLERDGSNADYVRLALAAVLGLEGVSVEKVMATVRYRQSDGQVRFLRFGTEEMEQL